MRDAGGGGEGGTNYQVSHYPHRAECRCRLVEEAALLLRVPDILNGGGLDTPPQLHRAPHEGCEYLGVVDELVGAAFAALSRVDVELGDLVQGCDPKQAVP